jgi:hypothetical protein
MNLQIFDFFSYKKFGEIGSKKIFSNKRPNNAQRTRQK